MSNGSFVAVTSGAGPKLSTGPTYSDETSSVVQDQKVILGEPYEATYSAVATNISGSTALSHMMEVMAGASLNVRIKYILVTQNSSTASGLLVMPFVIYRLTSAGTGGSAQSVGKWDNSDASAGATAMTLPSAKGTETTALWAESTWADSASTTAAKSRLEWPRAFVPVKPIIIPAGVANGIAIKNANAVATATWDITVVFTETIY